jgi:hypothetical protein
MKRITTDLNPDCANIHEAGYIEKHLTLLKNFWKQLELVNPDFLEGLEKPEAKNNYDPLIRACHHLLWGVFYYNDGDMVRGHDYLMHAEQLLQGLIVSQAETISKNDLYAYALCEISIFYYRLFDMKHTWNYLSLAGSFALSKPVRVVVETIEKSFKHNRFFMDVIPGDRREFDACLDFLRKNGIEYWLVIGLYYRIALNISLDLLDQTLDNYIEGSELCRKLDLDTYQSAFQMTLGLWYANHKEWQTALKYYKEAFDLTQSPYRQALCLENTASLYERYPNHEKRSKVLLKLLSHCEKYRITQKVPVACYYLANYYLEQEKDLTLAKYYFKKGYDAAIEMQDHGIYLFTRLARIVREYPEFIEKHYLFQTSSNATTAFNCLTFCMNQDWRNLKYTFQHALLLYHREHTNNGNELLHHLKLKPSTLHAIRHKLTEAGFSLPDLRFGYAHLHVPAMDPALTSYCSNLANLDWKAANLRFQIDALSLLLKHNHYNKIKLSQQLKISYPTVIKLLKPVIVESKSLPSS